MTISRCGSCVNQRRCNVPGDGFSCDGFSRRVIPRKYGHKPRKTLTLKEQEDRDEQRAIRM